MERERVGVLIFIVVGLAAGLASSFVNKEIGVAIGVSLLAALTYTMSKVFKEKVMFFKGDMFIYVMFWIISWTLILNVI